MIRPRDQHRSRDPLTDIEDRVKTLPPLSPGAGQLLVLMTRQQREPADIVHIVERDAVLTTGVLRYVNSATFTLNRQIATVKEAVAYLGEARVVSVAMAAAAGGAFQTELVGYHGSRGDLGRHSLYVGLAARELARRTQGQLEPGVAFTAGLLHDIGKAIISEFLRDDEGGLSEALVAEDTADFLAAERRHLGTDHGEVGAAVANHWGLPYALRIGIKLHHAPGDATAEERATAYVVHLADRLAMEQGHGTGDDTLRYPLDPGWTLTVRAGADDLAAIAAKVRPEFEAASAVLFPA
jgi:putative nucleotidyltransferase with HDIG domain